MPRHVLTTLCIALTVRIQVWQFGLTISVNTYFDTIPQSL